MDYQDSKGPLGIIFRTRNVFVSLRGQKGDAYFSVPGGSYSFGPDVLPISPGVFSLAFSGPGQFTGSNFARAARVDLGGTVDENTGAVDLTLKAEGSVFHLAIAPTEVTGAVALSKRIAADIESKNWSDVYEASGPTLKSAGYPKADLARYLNVEYGHVSRACRIGPSQYVRDETLSQVLGDRFEDVLAITVIAQSRTPVATFALIHLQRENGVWVFLAGNPPGVGSDGTQTSQQFGIPVPSP